MALLAEDSGPGVKIRLDLTRRTDVQRYSDEREAIQVEALKKLRRLLAQLIQDAAGWEKPPDSAEAVLTGRLMDRRHATITVHGRRGSGKTTFLYNFLEDAAAGRFPEIDPDRIALIGVIDPTLMERKENVFIVLLSLIKERIDQHHEKRKKAGDPAVGQDFQAWSKTLFGLASGLAALDGVGRENPLGEQWEDPSYVLERGLKQARGGSRLEQDFHDFLDQSLAFLGKSVFVLALDDIDTDFQKGWPILEVVRKYLTSRRLIVILSGNLELYTLLVRSNQWRNMPTSLRLKERKHWHLYEEMIDELQGQYLQKVLKPENRIELMPLSFYANSLRPEEIEVVLPRPDRGPAEPRTLHDLVEFLATNAFYLNAPADRQQLGESLLRQPLRTVFQVFRAAVASGLVGKWEEAADVPLDGQQLAVTDAMRAFHESLTTTFIESLLEKGVPFERLNAMEREDLLPAVVGFLNHNDAWQEGYRLKAEFQDDAFNWAAMTLGARLALEFNRFPKLWLDYFVKIGGTREAILLLPARDRRVRAADYTRFVGLEASDSALQVARRSLAAWREDGQGRLDRTVSQMGTIAILGPKTSPRRNPAFFQAAMGTNPHILPYKAALGMADQDFTDPRVGQHFNTLASLEANILTWQAAYLNLPAANVLPGKGAVGTFFSIHNLLGLLADMIGSADPLGTLARAAQLRSFPTPNWGTAGAAPSREFDEGDGPAEHPSHGDLASSEPGAAFLQALEAWAHDAATPAWRRHYGHPPPFLPVHIAAKTWTRFFYTLRRIDEELPARDHFVGHLLHRYIVAFLNAVLVEEHLHLQPESGAWLELRNPIVSDRTFQRNLRILGKRVDRLLPTRFWRRDRSTLRRRDGDHGRVGRRHEAGLGRRG